MQGGGVLVVENVKMTWIAHESSWNNIHHQLIGSLTLNFHWPDIASYHYDIVVAAASTKDLWTRYLKAAKHNHLSFYIKTLNCLAAKWKSGNLHFFRFLVNAISRMPLIRITRDFYVDTNITDLFAKWKKVLIAFLRFSMKMTAICILVI